MVSLSNHRNKGLLMKKIIISLILFAGYSLVQCSDFKGRSLLDEFTRTCSRVLPIAHPARIPLGILSVKCFEEKNENSCQELRNVLYSVLRESQIKCSRILPEALAMADPLDARLRQQPSERIKELFTANQCDMCFLPADFNRLVEQHRDRADFDQHANTLKRILIDEQSVTDLTPLTTKLTGVFGRLIRMTFNAHRAKPSFYDDLRHKSDDQANPFLHDPLLRPDEYRLAADYNRAHRSAPCGELYSEFKTRIQE
jgi:hypothetical protein